MSLKGKDIIIISSIDWSHHWQLHHHLATALVESGNRVLFMDNTGSRGLRVKDLGRVVDRVRNWLKGMRGFWEVRDNLVVFSPLFLPLQFSRLAWFVNRGLVLLPLWMWMRFSQYSSPLVISFLPTPLAQSLIEELNPILTVYYCADHMAGVWGKSKKSRAWENQFFEDADAVFVTSKSILERAERFGKRVYSFPAGVNLEKFVASRNAKVPEDIAGFSHPVIGYVGAISHVLDQELVVGIAEAMPEATIAFVGPKYTNTSTLERCPNVRLLGERPHDQVPVYIKGFDIALIPYVVNEFTNSVYSCKLNEYLAMGAPVVSTATREMVLFEEKHGDIVEVGTDKEDFIEKVRKAAQGKDEATAVRRMAVAEQNSWSRRFAEMSEVLEELLDEKAGEKVEWRTRFKIFYRRSITRWAIRFGTLMAAYLLLFNTPLVWLLGDQLTIRHQPQAVDAIVVFSGRGESAYHNTNYQRRAFDAVRYYHEGFAPSIMISSGSRQTFKEVRMIRALLVEHGVPEQDIFVLDQYPSSTYETVVLIKQKLDAAGAESILFMTSPYHLRRSLWIWQKQAPGLIVIAPTVIDTPPIEPQWSTTIDQIKIIGYEYMAILYNWYKGWL